MKKAQELHLILATIIATFCDSPISKVEASELLVTSSLECIEEKFNQLDTHSLVLFDVDATLIIPQDAILVPRAKSLFKKLVAGCKDRDLFRDIRLSAVHSLVDANSVSLIQRLQEKKIPTLAFTAAPGKINQTEHPGTWRVNELKRYGFDFSSCFTDCDFLELSKDLDQEHVPLFKSGVLYSSFHLKGGVLVNFLDAMKIAPNKVVFIDDELWHVESVMTSLDKLGIPCIGIHYTAADESAFELNEEVARFQVNHFIDHDIWISDQDSLKLLYNMDFIRK